MVKDVVDRPLIFEELNGKFSQDGSWDIQHLLLTDLLLSRFDLVWSGLWVCVAAETLPFKRLLLRVDIQEHVHRVIIACFRQGLPFVFRTSLLFRFFIVGLILFFSFLVVFGFFSRWWGPLIFSFRQVHNVFTILGIRFMCTKTHHFACIRLLTLVSILLLLGAHLLEHLVVSVFLNLQLYGRGIAIIRYSDIFLFLLFTIMMRSTLTSCELRGCFGYFLAQSRVCGNQTICFIGVRGMCFNRPIAFGFILCQSLAVAFIAVTVLNIQLWLYIWLLVLCRVCELVVDCPLLSFFHLLLLHILGGLVVLRRLMLWLFYLETGSWGLTGWCDRLSSINFNCLGLLFCLFLCISLFCVFERVIPHPKIYLVRLDIEFLRPHWAHIATGLIFTEIALADLQFFWLHR